MTDVDAPSKFFGFSIGSRHLRHAQVVDYLEYLASVSDRVQILRYADSYGERPLLVAAITSAEHQSQLGTIRQRRRALTSGKPKGSPDDRLLVMYMGYSIHGDEASGVNAAPLIAYHLATSESDEVQQWLAQSIFLIDPALNPDGIDRFANWSNENRGRFPSSEAVSREHHQPWPGGRTSYYWFDLNRDWLPLSHPESRGRVRLFHQWKPNVVLDFHEMSGNSSYFFQPGVPERNNPLSPPANLSLTRTFAAEHARTLDAANELYYTEERFDDFYVGKGSTYPDLHGAIGILFEQGSTRGLSLKNARTDRSFADTVANHVRTSLSSLRVATGHRSELLDYQRDFYRQALAQARAEPLTAYVLTGEPSRIQAASALLRQHAIQSHAVAEEVRLQGTVYPPGSCLVIPTAQPEITFVRSLMEPLQRFPENIFYDVSTWHLPSAFDLDLHRWQSDLPAKWVARHSTSASARSDAAPGFSRQDTAAGFALDAVSLKAPGVVSRLQRMGTHIRVTTRDMVADPTSASGPIRAGSFLILRQPNAQRWQQIQDVLQRAVSAGGVLVQPIASGMTAQGPDLGSDTLLNLPACKPLLFVGPGTDRYMAGALWHFMDVQWKQPTTVVDTSHILQAQLRDYSCCILPSGNYESWTKREAGALEQYLLGGGTLVAVGSSTAWLKQHELLDFSSTLSSDTEPASSSALSNQGQASTSGSLNHHFGDAADTAALELVAGAFLETHIDPTHPLAFGFPDRRVPVFRDSRIRFAPTENPYQTAAKCEHVIAGYVSERNRERFYGSPAVWAQMVGQGRIIVLADNPVFRGYVRSSERFFTNAILLGPALRIPAAPSTERAVDAAEHAHEH